jgi:hypothetical protein
MRPGFCVKQGLLSRFLFHIPHSIEKMGPSNHVQVFFSRVWSSPTQCQYQGIQHSTRGAEVSVIVFQGLGAGSTAIACPIQSTCKAGLGQVTVCPTTKFETIQEEAAWFAITVAHGSFQQNPEKITSKPFSIGNAVQPNCTDKTDGLRHWRWK